MEVMTMKYRKKPVVIEAFHHQVGQSVAEFQKFMGGNEGWHRGFDGELYIQTL